MWCVLREALAANRPPSSYPGSRPPRALWCALSRPKRKRSRHGIVSASWSAAHGGGFGGLGHSPKRMVSLLEGAAALFTVLVSSSFSSFFFFFFFFFSSSIIIIWLLLLILLLHCHPLEEKKQLSGGRESLQLVALGPPFTMAARPWAETKIMRCHRRGRSPRLAALVPGLGVYMVYLFIYFVSTKGNEPLRVGMGDGT